MNNEQWAKGIISNKGEICMTATKGLEGIVATASSVSSIIDDTLTYVGYKIDDLAENAIIRRSSLFIMAQKTSKSS